MVLLITLSNALLIRNTSERYLKTTGVNASSILSWRKRVNHNAISPMSQSIRPPVDCLLLKLWLEEGLTGPGNHASIYAFTA